jgi:hypothetical protein
MSNVGNVTSGCGKSLPASILVASLCAWTVVAPAAAHAAEALETEAKLRPFSLRLGVYDMNLDTEARLDGRGGRIGTRLDFEDDLNLDDQKETFDVAFRWRFAERHFLEAEYFSLNRNGFRRVDGEIRFGDTTFPLGANINSSFTTEVTRLSYAYRLVRSRNWGLALGAGLHVTRLHTALTEIAFDNIGVPIGDQEIAAVTAPLPVFGFSGARRLSENWTLLARGQYLSVKVDEIDGSIEHGAIQFEYDPGGYLGAGFGYDWFNVNIRSEDRFWIGRAEVRFHGPVLYLTASF